MWRWSRRLADDSDDERPSRRQPRVSRRAARLRQAGALSVREADEHELMEAPQVRRSNGIGHGHGSGPRTSQPRSTCAQQHCESILGTCGGQGGGAAVSVAPSDEIVEVVAAQRRTGRKMPKNAGGDTSRRKNFTQLVEEMEETEPDDSEVFEV